MLCNAKNVGIFKQELERKFRIKNLLVWVKNNHGTGDLKGDFAPKHELIWFVVKGRPLLTGKRIPNVLNFAKTGNKLHPTEKPVDLMEELIKSFSKENDVILDPFMGSGSTLVACNNLNRKYIGVELSEEYFDITKKRLDLKE